jgi:hypothetical protein
VGHAVILPPLVQQGDEGLEGRVASSPSPQHILLYASTLVVVHNGVKS